MNDDSDIPDGGDSRDYVPPAATRNDGPSPSLSRPPPDSESCPVRPLGQRGGIYFLFSPSGEKREVTSRQICSREGQVSLFDAKSKWLIENIPAFDKAGTATGSWSVPGAGAWLIRQCADAGIFDPRIPVRGLGVWRNEGGALVHCGDRVIYGDTDRPAGFKLNGALYPAHSPIPVPSDPCGAEVGVRLREALALWSYGEHSPDPALAVGPDLVLGWIGVALLGALPSWRAHLFVTGQRGCGKSWLADLVSATLGDQGNELNNFSEAGLRQSMTGEARAIILDEAEHDADGRVQATIELLRHMSSGKGSQSVRGAAGGRPQYYSVVGVAYMSSILRVPLTPQDRSRITLLKLLVLPTGDAAIQQSERALNAIQWAGGQSLGLRARAIAHWPHFAEAFQVFRAELLQAGCDSRQADQMATLLAGRDILIADAPPTGDELSELVARFGPLIAEVKEADAEQGEGDMCLQHLYSSSAESWRSGNKHTIGQVAASALESVGVEERSALRAFGMRVDLATAEAPARLTVAYHHEALRKVYAGTRWADGGWAQALFYLDGAKPSTATERFGGARSRGVVIPSEHWPKDD